MFFLPTNTVSGSALRFTSGTGTHIPLPILRARIAIYIYYFFFLETGFNFPSDQLLHLTNYVALTA